VAQSLWQGQFRLPRPLEDDAAEPAPPSAAAPEKAGSTAGSRPGSSSGPLSDPHRPFAKSVAQLGVQVAEALEYAAGQGVLHRDVKPSNLLLDVWGTVWLTDFGLAKASGTPDLTRTGDLLGTLRYMAPERFQGHADVRSDVYALGLTLYEILALRPAFGGQDQAELVRHITMAEAKRLERIDPRLPRDLVTIVHKAMARSPGDRYQTPAALADDLRRFLDDRSILARRASLAEQTWQWCRRNPTRFALLVALLALVGLVAGGGVWLVREQAERRAAAARQEETLRSEVGTALAQAVAFRKGLHFRQGRELLHQVSERLEPDGPDDLRWRLDQERANLDLAEQLDAARLQAATVVEGGVDFAGGERLYAAALAKAGLGREGDDIKSMAERVRASALREEVVAALDDWASLTTLPRRRKWLLAVARSADQAPGRNHLRQPELWEDGAQLTQLVGEVGVSELSPQLATALARAASQSGGGPTALLTAAQARFPNDFWLNLHLATTLQEPSQLDEALGYYRAALALRPEAGAVHNNFGIALAKKGRLDEAIRHLEQALRLNPQYAAAHYNLATALRSKGRLDEAITQYQQAVRIDPRFPLAHNGLGSALRARGRLDKAIDHYHTALRLAPNLPQVHSNLGEALRTKGRLNEAIDHYQQALRLDPQHPEAHNNLGTALWEKGRLDEAIVHYRQALRRDPGFSLAHYNLGNALDARGRPDEAIDHYRQALRLDPRLAQAHNGLGNALSRTGRLNEAVRHYWQAFRLDPTDGRIHCNLGLAMLRQGHIAEGVARLKRGHELGSKDPRWPYPSGQWLEQAERLAALDRKLPAVLQGKRTPASAAERLQFADLCRLKKRYSGAARLYAAAFAADPRLAGDLLAGHRYNAACCAALTAFSQGGDTTTLDARQRARWRKQALDWLRAELAAWAKVTDRALVQRTLEHWQKGPDLGGLRDREALAKLPAGERKEWRRLWADVEALRSDDPMEQSRTNAPRRQWARAADCYTRAVKLLPIDDGHFWFEDTAVLLLFLEGRAPAGAEPAG
jgi:serine/threonine-protein kinase